jgi:hypothetical protein
VPTTRTILAAALLLAAAAACARPAPQTSPAPDKVAVVRPRLRASERVQRAPATPAARATPVPAPRPTPVRRPPNAPPRILDVQIASSVRAGQRVTGHVITTSNVASVEVRIATYGIAMHKTGVGTFSIDYAVAELPFFLKGTYTMRIIARNTGGASQEWTQPLTIL